MNDGKVRRAVLGGGGERCHILLTVSIRCGIAGSRGLACHAVTHASVSSRVACLHFLLSLVFRLEGDLVRC